MTDLLCIWVRPRWSPFSSNRRVCQYCERPLVWLADTAQTCPTRAAMQTVQEAIRKALE